MINILLLGGSGQLGKVLKIYSPKFLNNEKVNLLSPTRKELDITSEEACKEYIKKFHPKWIINAAAYTKVDQAESEPRNAFLLNGEALKFLSKSIYKYKAKLLHISTDAVFNCKAKKLIKPFDKKNPINVYGLSKSIGEDYLREYLGNNGYIIRTSWLMGSTGKNFLKTIINLNKARENIKVVSDQFGYLTTSKYLAIFCWNLITKHSKIENIPKILHYCNQGETSWNEIANYIGEFGQELNLFKKKARIEEIKLKEYISPAKRSNFSLLDCSESLNLFKIGDIGWQKALREELILYKKNIDKSKN